MALVGYATSCPPQPASTCDHCTFCVIFALPDCTRGDVEVEGSGFGFAAGDLHPRQHLLYPFVVVLPFRRHGLRYFNLKFNVIKNLNEESSFLELLNKYECVGSSIKS